jgi:hypothetical protein
MPSFALKQEIDALESKLNYLCDEELKEEKVKERLSILYAQRQAENDAIQSKKAAEAKAAAAAMEKVAKKARKGAPVPEPQQQAPQGRDLKCRDCPKSFFFSDGEAAYYSKWEMVEPTRCADCRIANKAVKEQKIQAAAAAAESQAQKIQCRDCHKPFLFMLSEQKHFAAHGYADPVRCSPCRDAKKTRAQLAMVPINCERCKKDFDFTVADQLYYKQNKWTPPLRCKTCRPIHKAEWAAAQAAEKASAQAAEPSLADELIKAAKTMVNGDGTFKGE